MLCLVLFAGFCFYAYYKFVRYEDAPPERPSGDVTEIPAGLLPERPKSAAADAGDQELSEYNAYLAELAKTAQPEKKDRNDR